MNLEKALAGEYSFNQDPENAYNAYKEFGFHVEKEFFETDYCDYLIDQGNKLAQTRENNFKPALMPHKENSIFLEAMKHPKAVELIAKFVGGKPVGIQTQFFYCIPGTRGFSLHQDNFYVEADDNQFTSLWVALVDTNKNNGGLIIYPGSHKEGNLPVRRLQLSNDPGQDRNANNEETIVPSHIQSYNLTLAKGSALFIHAHVVHGSHSNLSDERRYSLLNLYVREGTIFRSGSSANRQPIALVD